MAALDLVNYVNNGFDKSEYTLGIFLDLSKAFDTSMNTAIIFIAKGFIKVVAQSN